MLESESGRAHVALDEVSDGGDDRMEEGAARFAHGDPRRSRWAFKYGEA
jgi:hypothetical protein